MVLPPLDTEASAEEALPPIAELTVTGTFVAKLKIEPVALPIELVPETLK